MAVVVAPITQKPAQVEQVVTTNQSSIEIDKPIVINACNLTSNYDWPKDVAYGICMAESGGRTTAANWQDKHHNCTGSFGLMQVACFWYPYYGYTSSDYYSTKINMDIAYKVYKRSDNFKAWSTFNNGAFKKFN